MGASGDKEMDLTPLVAWGTQSFFSAIFCFKRCVVIHHGTGAFSRWNSSVVQVIFLFYGSVFEMDKKRSFKVAFHSIMVKDTITASLSLDKEFYSWHIYSVIGCFLKRFSINVKKKCKKKWRWNSRKMKIWYKDNNIVVFIFAQKWFSNYDYFGWYGLLNV